MEVEYFISWSYIQLVTLTQRKIYIFINDCCKFLRKLGKLVEKVNEITLPAEQAT